MSLHSKSALGLDSDLFQLSEGVLGRAISRLISIKPPKISWCGFFVFSDWIEEFSRTIEEGILASFVPEMLFSSEVRHAKKARIGADRRGH